MNQETHCTHTVIKTLLTIKQPVLQMTTWSSAARYLSLTGKSDGARGLMARAKTLAKRDHCQVKMPQCWMYMQDALMRKSWSTQLGLAHATSVRIEAFRALESFERQRLGSIEDLFLTEPGLYDALVFFHQQHQQIPKWYRRSELMMIIKSIVAQSEESEQALTQLSTLTGLLTTMLKTYQPRYLVQNIARLASVMEWHFSAHATNDDYFIFAMQVDELAHSAIKMDEENGVSVCILLAIACRAYAVFGDSNALNTCMTTLLKTLVHGSFGEGERVDLIAAQIMPILAVWPMSSDVKDIFHLVTKTIMHTSVEMTSQLMETTYLIDTLLLCAQQRDKQIAKFEDCLRWPMGLYPAFIRFVQTVYTN